MKHEIISDALGKISAQYIVEAENYSARGSKNSGESLIPPGCQAFHGNRASRRTGKVKWLVFAAAAAFALCMTAFFASPLSRLGNNMPVTVYAQGTDEKITAAGAIINTGTISDSGKMTGQPLMFYLSGEKIATVRFSCKNQQISFADWTEKRDDYGYSQNFTIPYGEDASEYYYLLVNWEPNATIRALTDNDGTTIAALPDNLREDMIVMEITFADGRTDTKAITISLLDDGSFFAAYDDYTITEADGFVARPDAETIPRDILYAEDDSPAWSQEYPFGDVPVIEGSYQDADPNEPEKIIVPDSIAFTGTILFSMVRNGETQILVSVDEGLGLSYESVFFPLKEDTLGWAEEVGERVKITCGDFFLESLPPIGYLICIESLDSTEAPSAYTLAFQATVNFYEDMGFHVTAVREISLSESEAEFFAAISKGGVVQELGCILHLQQKDGVWEAVFENAPEDTAPGQAALNYYAKSIFQVEALKPVALSEDKAVFSVSVSKGDVVQEPERTIVLEMEEGVWEVTGEGY